MTQGLYYTSTCCLLYFFCTIILIYEEGSDSVDRALDWLVRVSPPAESLCCVLEQDTLSTIFCRLNETYRSPCYITPPPPPPPPTHPIFLHKSGNGKHSVSEYRPLLLTRLFVIFVRNDIFALYMFNIFSSWSSHWHQY